MLLIWRSCFIIGLAVIAVFSVMTSFSQAQSVTYTYDELNRLKTVTGGGKITTYNYDSVGNRTEIVQEINTIPPITAASPEGGSYNTVQTVTLTCYDSSGSGCDKTYFTTDGTTPTTSSSVYSSPISISATTTLKYFSTDNVGSSETVKTQIYSIDTIPPTGSIAINSGATTTTSTNVTLTLNCSDTNGCSRMKFSNDGTTYADFEIYSSTKAWIITSGEGVKTVYARFSDSFGNWSNPCSATILYDAAAPVTSASPPGGLYNANQSVALSCNDVGAGCDKIYYTTNGTTPTTSSSVYSSPISVSATTTLKYFARDLAGNNEMVKSETYTIDKTLPTGTVSINGGAQYTNSAAVILTLTCSDTNGCVQMQFSNDNSAYSSAEAYATTKSWTLTTGDGNKCVYVKFKDGAGNWSTAKYFIIKFDTTAPTTTASPVGGVFNTTQNVTLTCSDGSYGSGCDKIYYTVDGTVPTTSSAVYSSAISIVSSTVLKYFAQDKLGYTEAVKTQTYTIDTTPPTGTITINSAAQYTKTIGVTLTLSCTDSVGCSQMQFSNDNATYSTYTYAATRSWNLTTIDGTKTMYVKFKDVAGNWSTAYSSTIILDTALPVTTASPPGGTYTGAQSVTLTCSDGSGSGCDNIYYTTNGTTPTTSSPVYSSPISFSVTSTLKFFAKDIAGNNEAAKTQTYTIQQ